ncbi:unnamed protein product, partial [Urochloa humidicola]
IPITPPAHPRHHPLPPTSAGRLSPPVPLATGRRSRGCLFHPESRVLPAAAIHLSFPFSSTSATIRSREAGARSRPMFGAQRGRHLLPRSTARRPSFSSPTTHDVGNRSVSPQSPSVEMQRGRVDLDREPQLHRRSVSPQSPSVGMQRGRVDLDREPQLHRRRVGAMDPPRSESDLPCRASLSWAPAVSTK